ncbi:hypothetical protein [Cysteiniphilum sp. JM-1]|uniref:hypothetical protein n=1 Tax=Cysteiniphilum sp. JM-1 TaxID=2610891 RepID=UPI001245BD19|nr:hypothetical protein [Cysteiniphilum sp. JM-1]
MLKASPFKIIKSILFKDKKRKVVAGAVAIVLIAALYGNATAEKPTLPPKSKAMETSEQNYYQEGLSKQEKLNIEVSDLSSDIDTNKLTTQERSIKNTGWVKKTKASIQKQSFVTDGLSEKKANQDAQTQIDNQSLTNNALFETQQQIMEVQKEIKLLTNRIAKLDKGYDTLQKSQQTLVSKNEKINQELHQFKTDFTNDIRHMQMTLLKTAKAAKDIEIFKSSMRNRSDELTLDAISYDHAWLSDSNHKSISVMAGDEIPDYGKVMEVDYKNNRVVMESGFVFK